MRMRAMIDHREIAAIPAHNPPKPNASDTGTANEKTAGLRANDAIANQMSGTPMGNNARAQSKPMPGW